MRLVGLLNALHTYAEEWREAHQKQPRGGGGKDVQAETVEVMAPGELLARLGRKADGVNLLEIEAYLRRSKVWLEGTIKCLANFKPDCTENIGI